MANDYKYIDKSVITEVGSINNYHPGVNMVLVKPVLDTSIAGRHAKIHIDTFFEQIDYSRRVVEVVKTPPRLAIKGVNVAENSLIGLDWDTDMQLKVGDLAWVDPLAMVNNNDTLDTICLSCKGELYFVVKYDKFICAKRRGQKIMLNGYVLITKGLNSYQGSLFCDPVNTHSVVECVGKPNRSYSNPYYSDDIPVTVGDHITNPKNFIALEGSLHKQWEDNKVFYVIQRRHIHVNFKVYEYC